MSGAKDFNLSKELLIIIFYSAVLGSFIFEPFKALSVFVYNWAYAWFKTPKINIHDIQNALLLFLVLLFYCLDFLYRLAIIFKPPQILINICTLGGIAVLIIKYRVTLSSDDLHIKDFISNIEVVRNVLLFYMTVHVIYSICSYFDPQKKEFQNVYGIYLIIEAFFAIIFLSLSNIKEVSNIKVAGWIVHFFLIILILIYTCIYFDEKKTKEDTTKNQK
jgi:hypothetical protein